MKNNKRIITSIVAGMIGITSAASTALADDFETWYVNAVSGLNCRSTPEISDNIITAYPKGTELQIIGIDESGKWWEIWDGKTQGWCYSKYFVDSIEDIGYSESESNQLIDNQLENGKGTYLGNFYITGYTADPAENGGYAVTCMGDSLSDSVGWAIAVDPSVIPLGTKVYIEGIGYRVARDTGGAIKGQVIDVLTSSNTESYAITGHYDVYLAE